MNASPRIRRRDPAPAGDWPDAFPPLLRRLHAARGSANAQQAMPRLADLPPPDAMPGIDAGVALLAGAIARQRRIVVVADFDCDGATACAVGVRGLRMLGAANVAYAVPNRAVHGYGLTPGLVEELAALQPELLVTVDHGIACHAGIAAAKARGWRVLVTDHHLPGETLPDADAIVNPNLPDHAFGSRALAGVGVMFYLLLALRRHLRDAGGLLANGEPDLAGLLDLVAVGTVADLVPLDACNRALVGAGLRRLRAGQGSAGLRALVEVANRREATLTTSDIGFAIGPRINAAGRLEDMALGIECLLEDDIGRARELASTLDAINRERRELQQQTTDEADAALAALPALEILPPVLVLHDDAWHAGVIGLVASKLAQRTHRPAFVFAPAQPGSDELRGSARSIPGLHIRDLLAAVDAAHPGLIARFGGHAMAAGLTLARERLPVFDIALRAATEATLDPALLQQELLSDGELEANDFAIATAIALRDGGHWGQGYPEPLFDGEFDVLGWRIVGERHLKLELRLHDRRLNAIHFGGWTGDKPPPRVRIAYRLAPDDYRGGEAIQLLVVHREDAAAALPA